MTKHLLSILFLTLVLVAGNSSLAQYSNMTSLTYDVTLPVGNSADFIDGLQWRGVAFEARRFLDRQFSIGFEFGWHIQSVKSTDLIELPNGAISGTQVRGTNALPLLVTAQYYLSKDRQEIRPYAGLGAGMTYIDQRWDLGLYSLTTYNWHFTLKPEVGVIIPLGDVDGMVAASYTHAFDSGQTAYGNEDNTQQYFVFRVGLVWSRF